MAHEIWENIGHLLANEMARTITWSHYALLHSSPRQYLCDNTGTCLPHALELCLSGHCSLAGVEKCEVVVGELLVDEVINTLDTLPMDTVSMFEVYSFIVTVENNSRRHGTYTRNCMSLLLVHVFAVITKESVLCVLPLCISFFVSCWHLINFLTRWA